MLEADKNNLSIHLLPAATKLWPRTIFNKRQLKRNVEIAAKFAIPERQVKVNKLLKKMDAEGGDEQYCICRSTDISRFMIGCDNCNEWYHGDCIEMTPQESNYIKIFFCGICRKKDPSLRIKYKKKKSKEHSSSSSSRKYDKHGKHSHGDKKHHRHSHSHHKDRDRDRDREKDRYRRHRDKSKHDKHRKKDRHHDKDKKKKSSSVLGNVEDLSAMEAKSEPKSDSPSVTPSVTPVPGSPVATVTNSSATTSSTIAWRPDVPTPTTTSSSAGPQQLDPRKLDQVPPPPPSSAQLKQERQRELKAEKREETKKTKSARQCGQCPACNRIEDCGFCDNCRESKKVGLTNKSLQKCVLRQCRNYGFGQGNSEWDDLPTDDVDIPPHPSDYENLYAKAKGTAGKRGRPRKDATVETTPKRKYKKRKPETLQTPPKRKYKRRRQESSDEEESEEEEVKQCFGPGCIEPSRSGSKYCSDKCGLKLATDRIFEILPSRLLQWQAKPCVSEIKNKEQLEKIRQQQLELRKQLVELDKKHQEIDELVERAKKSTILSEEEDTEDDDPEMTIYCVTCGHQINQKTAVKHMEKCYAKLESLSSFGSIYKTRIEGNSMFCDYYSPQQGTYCKRLKVLCPEHTKEPKVGADEVCGCPLVPQLFTMTGEFCRLPKRKCNRHFCWEKLRRAAIDQERLSMWMKLDDLFEQERNIRVSMAERAGVLSLVLHQTIDHDPHSSLIIPPTRDVNDTVALYSM